jgi:membrane-bound lytic murein transglycosylase D
MPSIVLLLSLLLPAHAGPFKKFRWPRAEPETAPAAQAEAEDQAEEPMEGSGEELRSEPRVESQASEEGRSEEPELRVRTGPSADPSEQPVLERREGSLWDYVEEVEGSVPDEEAVQESEELDEERTEEGRWLVDKVRIHGPGKEIRPAGKPLDPADGPLYLNSIDPSEFDIPITVNDSVVKWMEYFLGSGRKYYARWLSRSTRVRPMMYEKLEGANQPRDLVYLSMIESGYSTHAYSRAAAVGLWQFITPTAKEWGMRVDWWVDERRDPEIATDHAIKFLSWLNNKFGHWYLAWAAYNGGPGRVDKGINRFGTRDFWSLVEKGAFHPETSNYVPKLIAAAIIGHHPERYGFTDIEYQAPLEYDTVEVKDAYGMDVLARCADVTTAQFQEMNPHVRRFTLPGDAEPVVLRIPKGGKSGFLSELSKVPPAERVTYRKHKVQRGETLAGIARKYGVSTNDLITINKIRNPNKIVVGTELTIPSRGGGGEADVALASTVSSAASPKAPTRSSSSSAKTSSSVKYHTVRKGESLSAIADRYDVSQSQLMSWNDIDNANKVYAGQKLKVAGGSSSSSSKSSSKTKSSGWTTYTVKSGDNLTEIANRYGCSVSELKSWNGIKGSHIEPGQKLKVKKG